MLMFLIVLFQSYVVTHIYSEYRDLGNNQKSPIKLECDNLEKFWVNFLITISNYFVNILIKYIPTHISK